MLKDGYILHPDFNRKTYIDELIAHFDKQEQEEKLNSFLTENPRARERLMFQSISIRH